MTGFKYNLAILYFVSGNLSIFEFVEVFDCFSFRIKNGGLLRNIGRRQGFRKTYEILHLDNQKFLEDEFIYSYLYIRTNLLNFTLEQALGRFQLGS